MKKYAANLLYLMLFCCIFGASGNIVAQTDYSVPLTFSVTSTGINRFIASQWNGIQHLWIGEIDKMEYEITLNSPTVVLSENKIKIVLKMDVVSNIYNGSLTLSPELTIPQTTVNINQIISQYVNLHDEVIRTAGLIDSRLVSAIEEALAPINWIVYEGQVISASGLRLTETSDIKLKEIPILTFSVTQDQLNLTINSTITSNTPQYSFEWMRSDGQHFGIRILSNNSFELGESKIDKIYQVPDPEEYNFTIESVPPIVATYNTTLQKYVAELYFHSSSNIVKSNRIVTRVYLKRANTETIWTLAFNTAQSPQPWTASSTSMTAIRGE